MAYDTDYDPDLDATYDEAGLEAAADDEANRESLDATYTAAGHELEDTMTTTLKSHLLDILVVLLYIGGLLSAGPAILALAGH
jgi:hypothetical protein